LHRPDTVLIDHGWSPTVLINNGHYQSARRTRVPGATAGLGFPASDPAGSRVERVRLSQLSAVSIGVSALAVASRIDIASATVPSTDEAPCAPWLAEFNRRAAEQSPPEVPLPTCSGKSSRDPVPPRSEERNARQTACRQVRYNDNRSVAAKRQPLSSPPDPIRL